MTNVALILLLASTTQTYSLPEGLLSAICWTESRHKTKAVNPRDGVLRDGERAEEPSLGMCQMKINTARQFESNITHAQLLSPKVNTRIAAKFLKWQLDRYHGDIICGIASYNAGSCRRNGKGLIKNRKYVFKVMGAWIDGR